MQKKLSFVVFVVIATLYGNSPPSDIISLSYAQYIQQYPGGKKDAAAEEKAYHIELAETLVKAGEIYARLGNHQEAIAKYQEALRHYATGELYRCYGRSLFNIESYSQSINAFKIAAILGVRIDASSYCLIARAHSLQKNVSLALEYLDLAIINGYRDIEEIQQHEDFAFLREQDGWHGWLSQRKAFFVSSKEIAARGLIAEWLFNNNAHDNSGNKHHGMIYGARWSSEGGLTFDGKDNYVAVENSPDLNPKEEITVSAWFKPASFKGIGNDAIIEKPYTAYQQPVFQYHLGVCGDQYHHNQRAFLFNVSVAGRNIQVQSPPGFYIVNRWYFLAGTYDGSYVRIYVNDQLMESKPASGMIDQYDTPVRIGGYVTLNARTPGTIDDVRIYSRALSGEEVKQIYSKGRQCD